MPQCPSRRRLAACSPCARSSRSPRPAVAAADPGSSAADGQGERRARSTPPPPPPGSSTSELAAGGRSRPLDLDNDGASDQADLVLANVCERLYQLQPDMSVGPSSAAKYEWTTRPRSC